MKRSAGHRETGVMWSGLLQHAAQRAQFWQSTLRTVDSYFFSPSLDAIVAFSNQLLVKKAVEKMNLREWNIKT